MSDARTRLSKTAQLLRDFCNEGDCHICKGCDFYELCEVGDTPKAIAEAIENELATCMSNEYIVTETCPHCGSEIEMRWSVEELGYKAFCPVCGERLMLCDECLHDADGNCTGNCDYDGKTDTCKYNKTPKADGRKAELDYILKYVEESDFSAFHSISLSALGRPTASTTASTATRLSTTMTSCRYG